MQNDAMEVEVLVVVVVHSNELDYQHHQIPPTITITITTNFQHQLVLGQFNRIIIIIKMVEIK